MLLELGELVASYNRKIYMEVLENSSSGGSGVQQGRGEMVAINS